MQWILRRRIIVDLYYSAQLQSEVLFQSIFINYRYLFALLWTFYINKNFGKIKNRTFGNKAT